MNCRNVERLLLEYLEHRLDPGSEAQVTEHTSHCTRCRLRFEEFKTTLALLADDPVPPMPISEERFIQDIRRRIRQRTRARAIPFPSSMPVFAAAAALLLVVGVLWQLRRLQPANLQPANLLAGETDVLDPLAADDADISALMAAESSSFGGIETELVDNSDVDDLIDDLAPAEQMELLHGLEQVYRVKGS